MLPIHLAYSLTQADILDGLRVQFRPWRMGLLMGGLWGALMFVFSLFQRDVDVLRSAAIWLAAGVGFGAFMVLYMWVLGLPLQARRLFRNNTPFYRDLTFEANEQGLSFHNARGLTRAAWDELAGYRENKRVFGLMLSKALVHPIPRTALTDEQRETLKAHIKQG